MATAGCNGVLNSSGNDAPPTSANTETVTVTEDTSTATPTSQENGETEDEPEEQDLSGLESQASTILLDLSDIGTGYDLGGERFLTRTNASEDGSPQLREEEALLRFERSFSLRETDSDRPSIVLSSVTIYENESTARRGYESLTSTISSQATSEEITILNEYVVNEYQFENSQGAKNTLIIRQSGQAVYYVVTSDRSSTYSEYTQQLFRTMLRGEVAQTDG